MRKSNLGDPHLGQNLAFDRRFSLLLVLRSDFALCFFFFSNSPKLLKSKPNALCPHKGHCASGSNLSSKGHLSFGHVQSDIVL